MSERQNQMNMQNAAYNRQLQAAGTYQSGVQGLVNTRAQENVSTPVPGLLDMISGMGSGLSSIMSLGSLFI